MTEVVVASEEADTVQPEPELTTEATESGDTTMTEAQESLTKGVSAESTESAETIVDEAKQSESMAEPSVVDTTASDAQMDAEMEVTSGPQSVLFCNLPEHMDEAELRRLFCELEDGIELRHSGNRCLMTLFNAQNAEAVVNLNGHRFAGCPLRVELVDSTRKAEVLGEFEKERMGLSAPPKTVGSHSLAGDPSTIGTIAPFKGAAIGSGAQSDESTVSGQQQSGGSEVAKAMALIEAMSRPPTEGESLPTGNGAVVDSATDELMRTIYIGNLNPIINEDHIKQFLADCGTVLHCKILGNAAHTSRYAFVEFEKREAAQMSYTKSGQVLIDRPLKIGKATNPIFKKAPGSGPPPNSRMPGVSANFKPMVSSTGYALPNLGASRVSQTAPLNPLLAAVLASAVSSSSGTVGVSGMGQMAALNQYGVSGFGASAGVPAADRGSFGGYSHSSSRHHRSSRSRSKDRHSHSRARYHRSSRRRSRSRSYSRSRSREHRRRHRR